MVLILLFNQRLYIFSFHKADYHKEFRYKKSNSCTNKSGRTLLHISPLLFGIFKIPASTDPEKKRFLFDCK